MVEETPEPQIAQKPAETAEMVAEIQSVEEKPTKPWLKIVLFSILGIFVFAGAVFGAYKVGQRQIQPVPKPTPTPVVIATPTPDPTADWKIYTNTKYGYSVKYPEDWEIRGVGGEEAEITHLVFIGGPPSVDVQGQMFIEANVPPPASAKAAFEKEKSYGAILEVLEEGEIRAGEIEGYHAVVRYSQEDYPKGQIRKFIYLIRSGILYHIDYLEWHRAKDINLPSDWQVDDTFNLMLSTFKFVE